MDILAILRISINKISHEIFKYSDPFLKLKFSIYVKFFIICIIILKLLIKYLEKSSIENKEDN